MKRSAGLQRHKPLLGSLDTHRAWKQRSRDNARRKALRVPQKAVTPKRRTGKHTGEREGRELVYGRSGGLCEVRIDGICLGPGMNWHHRLDRIHGGTWAASNGLHVCGSGDPGHGCHGALTTPPEGRGQEFEDNGWTVPSWRKNPPKVRVLRTVWRGDEWVSEWGYLTDLGGWTATDTHPRGHAA